MVMKLLQEPFFMQELHQEYSFQAVVSTNGQVSFAFFMYADPQLIDFYLRSYQHPEIGFSSKKEWFYADIGKSLRMTNGSLQFVNIFWIDGK